MTEARNFDYYEALTVRDSSLAACVQAVIAAEVGHLDLAYAYLSEAALIETFKISNTTPAMACTSPR
jgi:alpha,alpha-trehalose phosphorylase